MEDLTHSDTDPTGQRFTRSDLLQELTEYDEEIRHLEIYLRRLKTNDSVCSTDSEHRDVLSPGPGNHNLEIFVDTAFLPGAPHGMTGVPTWRERYFTRVADLRLYRDQLRSYAARRTGDPGEHGRYQNRHQWLVWIQGDPLPRPCGELRKWARRRFDEGVSYEETLWEVANQAMMYSGEQLDLQRARILKRAVEREYHAQFRQPPPKVARVWWHPHPDQRPTRGGLKSLGLAWTPRRSFPVITRIDLPPTRPLFTK